VDLLCVMACCSQYQGLTDKTIYVIIGGVGHFPA